MDRHFAIKRQFVLEHAFNVTLSKQLPGLFESEDAKLPLGDVDKDDAGF